MDDESDGCAIPRDSPWSRFEKVERSKTVEMFWKLDDRTYVGIFLGNELWGDDEVDWCPVGRG